MLTHADKKEDDRTIRFYDHYNLEVSLMKNTLSLGDQTIENSACF